MTKTLSFTFILSILAVPSLVACNEDSREGRAPAEQLSAHNWCGLSMASAAMTVEKLRFQEDGVGVSETFQAKPDGSPGALQASSSFRWSLQDDQLEVVSGNDIRRVNVSFREVGGRTQLNMESQGVAFSSKVACEQI